MLKKLTLLLDRYGHIRPETESAEQFAMRLDNINILDNFKVSEKYSIVETIVPEKYIGMMLGEATSQMSIKSLHYSY